LEVPSAPDPQQALARTTGEWAGWLGKVHVHGRYAEEVARSLLVLRGLTHRHTGGIIAAATTSLPADFGGVRFCDYRYCWLRGAGLSLETLVTRRHADAAVGWREWLLRAIAGDPEQPQVMDSIVGSRNLPEQQLPQPPGYEGARPVRTGNGAVG